MGEKTAKSVKMARLDDIANGYGTDKGSAWHGYAEQYERILRPLRDSVVRAVVEIGVCRKWDGNRHICPSLAMWRDWFAGPGLESVIGLDKCDFGIDDPPILTLVCDQGVLPELEIARRAISRAVGEGGVDLIVDDGSHEAGHQQITLKALWPLLRGGGAYVIEDLNYNPEGADKSKRMRTREAIEDWLGGEAYRFQVGLVGVLNGVSRVDWAGSAKAGPKSAVVLWKKA